MLRWLQLRLIQLVYSLLSLPLRLSSPVLPLRVRGINLAISYLSRNNLNVYSFRILLLNHLNLFLIVVGMSWRQHRLFGLLSLGFRNDLILLEERAQNDLILLALEKLWRLLVIDFLNSLKSLRFLAIDEFRKLLSMSNGVHRFDWGSSTLFTLNDLSLDGKEFANLNLIDEPPRLF